MVFINMVNEAAALVAAAEQDVLTQFHAIDEMARKNTRKVLSAMWAERVAETDLYGSTGYGYGDPSRDKLERVYARVFGAQRGIVRPQIISGTHALRLALFGVVHPGDHVVIAAGQPYDTMEAVLGLRPAAGSLTEWGVATTLIPLAENGSIQVDQVLSAIRPETTVVTLQKSRGYQARRTFSTERDLGPVIRRIKDRHPGITVFVDNCYGEFTEAVEPCDVGADIAAGSLIKNPGAGLAPTGGYIVGREDLIERIGAQVTAPGVGLEAGPTYGFMRLFFQGLFMAPHTVAQAVKTSTLFASVLTRMGYEVSPLVGEPRFDLILSVNLGSADELLAFCRAIQAVAPIDSHVKPEGAPMPGYESDVVMAAGAFVQGSSIELSADGPMRPPYTAFLQGGLTYEHGYIAAERVVGELLTARQR